MHDVLDSPWGRLFRNWEQLTSTADGFPQVGSDAAQIEKTGLNALRESFGILATMVGLLSVPFFAREEGDQNPMTPLNGGFYVLSALCVVGLFITTRALLGSAWPWFFACGIVGRDAISASCLRASRAVTFRAGGGDGARVVMPQSEAQGWTQNIAIESAPRQRACARCF